MKNGLREHNPQNLMSTMWRNWAVATGALMLPMACSLFMPKIWPVSYTHLTLPTNCT